MTRKSIELFNAIRRRKLYECRSIGIELRGQTVPGVAGAPMKMPVLEVGGVIVEIEQVVRFEIAEFASRGFAEPVRWEAIKAAGVGMVVADYTVDFEAGEYVVSLASSRAKP